MNNLLKSQLGAANKYLKSQFKYGEDAEETIIDAAIREIKRLETELKLVKYRNNDGAGCVKAIVKYIKAEEIDIHVLLSELGETVLRLSGNYYK